MSHRRRLVWLQSLLLVAAASAPLAAAGFIRGDSNSDDTVNISDPSYTLAHLFTGGPPPECPDAADANDSGKVDLSDAVYTLNYLFLGGPASPEPFTEAGCDPTAESPELGCRTVAKPYDFTCRRTGPVVDLAWENGQEYDEIQVLRDGSLLTTRRGTANTYQDRREGCFGDARYEVVGLACGERSEAASCSINGPLDDPAPSITVLTPAPGAILASPSARVRVRVTDDGIITKVLIDGASALPAPAPSSVEAALDVTLLPGQNLIHIEAIDDAGRTSFKEIAVGVVPLLPHETSLASLDWALRAPAGLNLLERLMRIRLASLPAVIDEAVDAIRYENDPDGIPGTVTPKVILRGQRACITDVEIAFESVAPFPIPVPIDALTVVVRMPNFEAHASATIRSEPVDFYPDGDIAIRAREVIAACRLQVALSSAAKQAECRDEGGSAKECRFDWDGTSCDVDFVDFDVDLNGLYEPLGEIFQDKIESMVSKDVEKEAEAQLRRVIGKALESLLTKELGPVELALAAVEAGESGVLGRMGGTWAPPPSNPAYPDYPGVFGRDPPQTDGALTAAAPHAVVFAACISLGAIHRTLDHFAALGQSRRTVDVPPIAGQRLTVKTLSQLLAAPFECLPGVSGITPIQARIELRQAPTIILGPDGDTSGLATLKIRELTLTLAAGSTDLIAFGITTEAQAQLRVEGGALRFNLVRRNPGDPSSILGPITTKVTYEALATEAGLMTGLVGSLLPLLLADLAGAAGSLQAAAFPIPSLGIDLGGDDNDDAVFTIKSATIIADDTDGGGSDWLCLALNLDWSWADPVRSPGLDFNGDGYADLAIGVPGESLTRTPIPGVDLFNSTASQAGMANVLYGSAGGLTTDGSQAWHQDSAGVAGAPQDGDYFASTLAGGDFDGDGFLDLAIGAPGESVCGAAGSNAGIVQVLPGSRAGLTSAGDQVWHQDDVGVPGGAEAGDAFGSSLAAGDFDGDGFFDLAAGARYENLDGGEDAGMVNVLYGSPLGLTAERSQAWHQDDPGITGNAETNDLFGSALTAADFDGDHFWDLAIGVPGENLDGNANAGTVHVLYGSATGLSSVRSQGWDQDDGGIPGAAEAGDQFGSVLAAGDFNRDGYADLAIGTPNESLSSDDNAGHVTILYGSGAGLTSSDSQGWDQDDPAIPGGVEAGDLFGASLTAGDFDGDGFADLAIGVPGEDLTGGIDGGLVNVLYGSAGGLSAARAQAWDQDDPGIGGGVEPADRFGASLAAGDFNNDGRDDLAIGAQREDLAGESSAGLAVILFGAAGGLTSTGSETWSQEVDGISGAAERCDHFGSALAGAVGAGSRDVTAVCLP